MMRQRHIGPSCEERRVSALQSVGPVCMSRWRSEVTICADESSQLPRIMALEGFIDLLADGTNLIRRIKSCGVPERRCGGEDED